MHFQLCLIGDNYLLVLYSFRSSFSSIIDEVSIESGIYAVSIRINSIPSLDATKFHRSFSEVRHLKAQSLGCRGVEHRVVCCIGHLLEASCA